MLRAALIFALTYLVIALHRLPRLHLGRPAGALLGAVAMVASGVLTFDEAVAAVDFDTILFLLGMMIVIAYLELSGFFEILERRLLRFARGPRSLLWLVVGSSGVLSALFMNDTICLMLTPVVVRVARRVELNPVPYLVALATASNIGSACTLMGNPQNALIAIRLDVSLGRFLAALFPVSLVGLGVCGLLIQWVFPETRDARRFTVPPPRTPQQVQRWMLCSSLLAGAGMVGALFVGVRPAAAAMTAGAAVILAGAARPREALPRVDWSLLLFFGGLFVVMRAVEQAGLTARLVEEGSATLGQPEGVALAGLALVSTALSQLVSNVPATMLLLPLVEGAAANKGLYAVTLAAFTTLAGNLTLIGSVANIIVFEGARREGVEVSFAQYLKAGLPLTCVTLGLAWAWLVFWS